MPDDLETLRFLYDKRMTLFNVRREHEWKVFFAVITAMGLLDAAIVTQHVCLRGTQFAGWVAILAVLSLACGAYEYEVQRRNRIDRIAMHEMHDALCKSVEDQIRGYTCIRHPADHATKDPEAVESYHEKRLYSFHFLWAFWWQIVVLIFVSIVSILFIPGIGCLPQEAGAKAGSAQPPTASTGLAQPTPQPGATAGSAGRR
jgi:hypothetical protein